MADATQSFYGRWAALYDRLSTLPGVGSWRAAAADELHLDPGDIAVEMGCGTGANLPFLCERVNPGTDVDLHTGVGPSKNADSDGHIVGIDVTRPMLERARGHTDASLVYGDATRPPVCKPVDGLLGTFVVAMFAEPQSVVDEWCDHVRPGGRVALLHFTRSDRWWAAPVNAAYRTFVWLSSADRSRLRDVATDVATDHDERVRTAHDALAARTTEYHERALAGGYLSLASGRVTSSDS